MKITIIAAGSRGDVQPYVALGQGLQAAGHTVQLLATAGFQSLVAEYGLDFVALGGPVEAAAQNQLQAIAERGNLLEILASTGRGARQLVRLAAVSGLAAGLGADLILGGLGALPVGGALSEKLGVPFVQAYLMPFTPTREFPSVLTPLPQTRWTAWANGLSHHLARQLMWQTFRAADNRARAEVLDLPPGSFWGPFAALQQQPYPILYGYSPQVVPPPADWQGIAEVTGYWLLEPPAGWAPPPELVDFLEAGPPPVYIGFGSMPSRQPEATAELVLRALALTGQRGVISAGWGGMRTGALPKTVYAAGSLPHSWLFPRLAAVVHHGGAGTTAAGLWAGVPSIITPFFGDQPFWGRRVHALGVGPRPIPRPRLTAENLAEAIRAAVSDPALRERAAALGRRVRAERGVDRAVAVIEQSRPR